MKKVIINADDFGIKSSVNKAIIECFNSGVIKSTTLMANMPGFGEAISLAHENNITGKIGIHLTLSEGDPLTSEILNTDLFFHENNKDLKKHKKRLFMLRTHEKRLIFNEFAAQVEKVKNGGIHITHIDTHHHIDEVWTITNIILTLLKKYNIPSMRILYNLSNSTSLYKMAYRTLVNNFIKVRRSNYSDFLGNQLEAVTRIKNDRSFIEHSKLEIMVHPDYNNEGKLIDKIKNREHDFNYPEELKKLLSLQDAL